MALLFRGTDRRLALFFGAPKPNSSAVTCRERRMEPDFPQRSSAFLGLIRFRRRGLRLRRSEYPALLSAHTRLRAGPFTWCRLPADVILWTSGMLSETVFCVMLNRRRRDAT